MAPQKATSQKDGTGTGSKKERKLEWESATFDNASSLGDVADPEGIKLVVEKVNEYFNGGDYKFWYFRSEDGKFTRVVVSEGEPDYDMSAYGNAPALGVALFTKTDSRRDKWRSMAAQIEGKGKSS